MRLKRSVKGHEDRTFSGRTLRFLSTLLVLITLSEVLKMVNVKRERKRATRGLTSKNETWCEEPTLSRYIIENSDEELAPLDD